MASDKKFVLDTSAIFCLKDNEAGADTVEEILKKAGHKQARVFVSFMTMMEYLYICFMRYGTELAHRSYLEATLLPIEIIESDENLRLIAAELKANYNMSVADAWIAALAKESDATLVHRDPEYDALGSSVKCWALPYK